MSPELYPDVLLDYDIVGCVIKIAISKTSLIYRDCYKSNSPVEKSDDTRFEQICLMVCGAGLPLMVRGVHGDQCRRSWLSAVHTGLDSRVRTQDGQQCRKWYEPLPSLVAQHLSPCNTGFLPQIASHRTAYFSPPEVATG